MSGITIDPSMSFDPYATSFDAAQLQTYSDFSPVLFDTEDFAADLTSDSAASPLSPLSPALSASSFGFPTTDAWTAWEAAELSPEPENLFGAPQTFPAACPTSNPAMMSPAINPKDLAVAVAAAPVQVQVQAPYFQSPQVMMANLPLPIQQQQRMQMQQMHMQLQPPAALPTATLPTTTTITTPSTNLQQQQQQQQQQQTTKRYPSRGLKRKSSTSQSPASASSSSSDDEDQGPPAKSPTTAARNPRVKTEPKEPTPAPKKTAHNMIEKRYRTNLNDKITQLREAVPSLRLMAQRSAGVSPPTSGAGAEGVEDAEEEGNGGNGASGNVAGAKLNKATILSKATEYILQLERRNHGLETENSALRGRMEGLEMMLMGGGARGTAMGGWN